MAFACRSEFVVVHFADVGVAGKLRNRGGLERVTVNTLVIARLAKFGLGWRVPRTRCEE